MRQVILDTETTGIRIEDGHRIIEIGCLEMIDRKLTGKYFHHYINPQREVEAGALAVHGISNEFLKDKPVFVNLVKEFMDFITGAELIIHNAPFDLGFLNNELILTRQGWKPILDYCRVVDTLQIARQKHPGQRNSLDALCKRYTVDNTKRDFHGALLDASLLAQVYLIMTGGQSSIFDAINEKDTSDNKNTQTASTVKIEKHNLTVLKATDDELLEHKNYLELLKKKGKCVWPE